MILATLPPLAYVSTAESPVGAGNYPPVNVANNDALQEESTAVKELDASSYALSVDRFPTRLRIVPMRDASITQINRFNDPFSASNSATRGGMARSKQISSLQIEIVSFVGPRWSVQLETARRARTAVAYLPNTVPLPQVKPSDEGELGLFWVARANRVEAIFMPEQKRLVWIGKFSGKFIPGGDVSWNDPMPTGLLTMLARLFG
jgi:hypothetical protein